MIDELIRKYGRYMGGIDYEKILNDLMSEEERLRLIEDRLIGIDTGQQLDREKIMNLERRRLILKYIDLKNQEAKTLELIKELKLRNYPRSEVTKAVRKLRGIRRQLRMIRRELKIRSTENPQTYQKT
ncbi:hypothetical protein [Vulcanisaeta souniana]|uniref:Uncharacterized protein n=1 Tax=Vulcanisaeta souniana JCM 11219 TaxID=1293586 RepID=A0A830EK87_9CREN|nr:hypothetical protein [Vulcanisaeta souniana]BDR90968.1 hypothetical protein Vsou_00610 [Vulcanisaeta souniana JCM 11219]GGI79681.1 hypothetical protein GCM10007112_15770 [Vulcanisaeta souniana JCM 11219]